MGNGLKKSVRYKAETCKHSTMSSNIDQHHMLSIVDTLHEKYQFQDGEYKEIVEALGGKKEPLDVENAKIVRITYDEISATLHDDEDDLEAIAAVGSRQTIREVIDTPDPDTVPGNPGEPGRFVHVRNENGWDRVPKSFTLQPKCTIINTAELKNLAYLMTTSHPYRSLGPALEIRINDIEVLVRA